MKISDLFDIKYGLNLELINCEITTDIDGINFVSRTGQNNGIVAKVKPISGIEPQKAGTLSCAAGGSVLSTFVQIKPYYSGRDLYVLTPKKEMTFLEKLFYAMCIQKNSYKYAYGRQANKTLGDIVLPDSIPEKFKRQVINYDILNTKAIGNFKKLNVQNWKYFFISDIFDIVGTKTTSKEELELKGTGIYPYITTQAVNNGVENFYNFFTENGNVLTIDSAVLGYCSYQERSFSASDHVEKLIPKIEFNKYIGLFIATIINQERYKYSYGRKYNQEKIKTTKIKLPVNLNGEPDYKYMENYILSLPYSDRI